LQRNGPAAGEQSRDPVLVHGHEIPSDYLIEYDLKMVFGNLPFGQPHVDLVDNRWR